MSKQAPLVRDIIYSLLPVNPGMIDGERQHIHSPRRELVLSGQFVLLPLESPWREQRYPGYLHQLESAAALMVRAEFKGAMRTEKPRG